MFSICRSLITLQAHLGEAVGWQVALAGRLPHLRSGGAKLTVNPVAGYQETDTHGEGIQWNDGDGSRFVGFLAAHDEAEFAVHQFLTQFHHVAVIVIPNQIHLFELRGRLVRQAY